MCSLLSLPPQRHAHSRAIYCEHSFPKLLFRRRLSSGDKVCFPPVTTEILGQLSSEVPSSVATFGTTIEQPSKAHIAFLHELVGRILVRRRLLDLPDLLLRPVSLFSWNLGEVFYQVKFVTHNLHLCRNQLRVHWNMYEYLKQQIIFLYAFYNSINPFRLTKLWC